MGRERWGGGERVIIPGRDDDDDGATYSAWFLVSSPEASA